MKNIFSDFLKTIPLEHKTLLFNTFIDNDLVGINIADANGQTIFLNDAHTRITGHPKEMYMNTTMYELEKTGKVSRSAVVRVIQTRSEVTLSQMTEEGKSFEVRGFPIFDKNDELQMVLCLLTDVTEIVNSRKKISEMEEYANILRQAISGDSKLVYQSPVMRHIVEKAKRIAATDASVLVTGPSGVGKELIADLIHESSYRKDKPFIKINCAAIPEQLLESELFGYEPGAFTGGNPKGKQGLIESANGGTLLLDEIGELPLMLQSKLLRTLQNHTIRRLGSNVPIDVDFRLISATNVDLKEKIKNKVFREDLYYRLNVIELDIPALKKRKDDIPLLVHHFIRMFNAQYDLKKSIESDALSFLCQYDYPGNVRELRNIIERLMVQSPENYISIKDAHESMGMPVLENVEAKLPTPMVIDTEGLSLKQIMENHEKVILQEYLHIYKTGSELAKFLKTDQSTISRKIAKYGIKY